MRIAEQVFRAIDRREADIEAVELFGELGLVPAPNHVCHPRNDARARQDPVGGGAQARIVQEFLQTELTTKALPMAFGDHADEDAVAACSVENMVDRPRMLALRHGTWPVSGHF